MRARDPRIIHTQVVKEGHGKEPGDLLDSQVCVVKAGSPEEARAILQAEADAKYGPGVIEVQITDATGMTEAETQAYLAGVGSVGKGGN